jgi:hypothetical protein
MNMEDGAEDGTKSALQLLSVLFCFSLELLVIDRETSMRRRRMDTEWDPIARSRVAACFPISLLAEPDGQSKERLNLASTRSKRLAERLCGN